MENKIIIHKENEIPEDFKSYLVKDDLDKYYIAVYEDGYGWKDAHSYGYIVNVVSWCDMRDVL